METNEVLRRLRSVSDAKSLKGMARYGITTGNAFGVSIPQLRSLAREIGVDHRLALQLWTTGFHEARILAGMIDDPGLVGAEQMEEWAGGFDSWDVCDQCCGNLFDKTDFAYEKAVEWSGRPQEFVKRAGFVLMASLAVHDKGASDKEFVRFLSIVERNSTDERNFVRKAVNWALRQVGKRNSKLNRVAIVTARRIQKIDSKASRWIATDALRELTSEAVQKRVRKRINTQGNRPSLS